MYRVPVKPTCINVKEIVTNIIWILIISSSPLLHMFDLSCKQNNLWMGSVNQRCTEAELFGGFWVENIIIIWSFFPETYTYINCLIFPFSEKQIHVMWLTLYSPVSRYNIYDVADLRLLLTMKAKKLTISAIFKKRNLCKSNKTLVGFLPKLTPMILFQYYWNIMK